MTHLHHTRLDQIGQQIEQDMIPDALGNRRYVFGKVYRFKVAHQSLHMVKGDTFLASEVRKIENRHGITIEVETFRGDEVLLTVKWVSRKVPA